MAKVYLLSEKRNMAEECSVSNTSIAISSFSSTATTYEQLVRQSMYLLTYVWLHKSAF